MLRRLAAIAGLAGITILTAACGHGTSAPHSIPSPASSAESQLVNTVKTHSEGCLQKIQILHPVHSFGHAVVPCEESLAPAGERTAFGQYVLQTGISLHVWKKANRPGWYSNLAEWLNKHGHG